MPIPQIVVKLEDALLDEPVEIVISNLPAKVPITLESSIKGKNNNVWVSRATFQANDKGIVNVAAQAPLSGSYKGIDRQQLADILTFQVAAEPWRKALEIYEQK